MSEFHIGDIVRIGGGKVEYLIVDRDSSDYEIESLNTHRTKWVEGDKFVVVESNSATDDEIKAPATVFTPVDYTSSDDVNAVQPTSYQIAILSGVQGLAHVFGGATLNNKFSKRRAKNKLAKQSRKANR